MATTNPRCATSHAFPSDADDAPCTLCGWTFAELAEALRTTDAQISADAAVQAVNASVSARTVFPRRNSTYQLEVPSDHPSEEADRLVALLPDRYGSGVLLDPFRAFIRFRVADDDAARALAARLTDHPGAVLHTGLAVHRREITIRPLPYGLRLGEHLTDGYGLWRVDAGGLTDLAGNCDWTWEAVAANGGLGILHYPDAAENHR